MKLGIVTPVLTLLPRAHATWEDTGTFADVVGIVQAADRLGYHHCTCSEHVAIPVDVAETRGGRYWDPLATFGALSAATTTIRFATHVLVLGYHHPLAIAKRYGTLDEISDGRVILGVGVGSLRGVRAARRAVRRSRRTRRRRDARAARRALATRPRVSRCVLRLRRLRRRSARAPDPCAALGRRSHRAFAAARVELGDGWAPFGLRTAELADMLARARDTEAWSARAEPIDVLLQNEHPLDPIGERERVTEQLAKFAEIGATGVNVRFVHHSPEHYCEQLAALTEIAT